MAAPPPPGATAPSTFIFRTCICYVFFVYYCYVTVLFFYIFTGRLLQHTFISAAVAAASIAWGAAGCVGAAFG